MRFDKFVSSFVPKLNVSNSTMNICYIISFLNSMYYVVYPKFLDLRRSIMDISKVDINEGNDCYDITFKHIVILAWAVFFFMFGLMFSSAISFIVNVTSLLVAIISILSIIVILSRRDHFMFKEFGRKIEY